SPGDNAADHGREQPRGDGRPGGDGDADREGQGDKEYHDRGGYVRKAGEVIPSGRVGVGGHYSPSPNRGNRIGSSVEHLLASRAGRSLEAEAAWALWCRERPRENLAKECCGYRKEKAKTMESECP